MSLEIISYVEGNKLIFKIEGFLDMSSFRDFEVELHEKIEKNILSVGISLLKCKAIDSSF